MNEIETIVPGPSDNTPLNNCTLYIYQVMVMLRNVTFTV